MHVDNDRASDGYLEKSSLSPFTMDPLSFYNRRKKGVTHMKIGIPKEIKNNENRSFAASWRPRIGSRRHEVLVEAKCRYRINFSDEAYRAVGATIVANAADVWYG